MKSYTSNIKCSVQEAVYHILPELDPRRAFPGVKFVNTNIPEKRSKILQTEEQLNSLPGHSNDIKKKKTFTVTLLDHLFYFVMKNIVYLILFALQNLLHITVGYINPKKLMKVRSINQTFYLIV